MTVPGKPSLIPVSCFLLIFGVLAFVLQHGPTLGESPATISTAPAAPTERTTPSTTPPPPIKVESSSPAPRATTEPTSPSTTPPPPVKAESSSPAPRTTTEPASPALTPPPPIKTESSSTAPQTTTTPASPSTTPPPPVKAESSSTTPRATTKPASPSLTPPSPVKTESSSPAPRATTEPASPAMPPPPTTEATSLSTSSSTPRLEDQNASEDASEEDAEREVTRIPLVGVQQGGILLQSDQLVLEPSLAYSISTNTRLIVSGFSVLPLIVLGDLESEKTTTQTFTPSLGFRYGLYRGLQVDFRIPYLLQTVTRLRVSTETTGQVEENSEEFGIGDVTFGFSYQFLYEQDWYPDMVIRIGATAPTGRSQFDIFSNIADAGSIANVEEFLNRLNMEGAALGTGRWFIDTSISGVKALDPAILFGTVGYSYSPPVSETLIRITANAVGQGVSLIPEPIEANLGPVNQISQSLGMAISLNNRVSMNFAFSNLVRFATKVDGQPVPDSSIHVANLNLGFNVALSPQITTNISGTIGLTPDAPDFAFTLTTPISISNPLGRSIEWVKELFSKAPSPQQPS